MIENYIKSLKRNEEAEALQNYFSGYYTDFQVSEYEGEFKDSIFFIKGEHNGCCFDIPVLSFSCFNQESDFSGTYSKYITFKINEYISKVKEIQEKFTKDNREEYHRFKNDILLGILQRGHIVSNVLRNTGKTSTIKYYAEKENLPILIPNKYLRGFYDGFVTFTPDELLRRNSSLSGTYLVDDISEDDYYSLLSYPFQSSNFKMVGFVNPKNK